MKVILLCSSQSNQVALASKVSKQFNLVGIVVEKKIYKHKVDFFFLLSKAIDRLLFYRIISSWRAMLDNYTGYSFPETAKRITVENINSKETIDFIQTIKPDLIMVSGTRIIKDAILNIGAPKGIINLHTGLSPYVKGAPNCTNWCISNNTLHLIGNTIMWIDKGIDSGNIITTETTDFIGTESLNEVHRKVMEHAHSLYLRALYHIENDKPCPSIKQSDIAKGNLFLNKEWNFKAKWNFTINMNQISKNLSKKECRNKQKALRLIKLPD